MSTTNEKPGQSPTTPPANTATPVAGNGTQERKPTTDESAESTTKDPTTTGDTAKKPTDPNNPQARSETTRTPSADQAKVSETA